MIDPKSLHQYSKVKGGFSRRLQSSIHWKKGVFKQDCDRRCAFLNENNLCDLYSNLGEKSLCKTCRLYPRHVEEFEGVREITLSVSCPEVARILLRRKEPVHFLTYEKPGEEEYEDFDLFLHSMLQEAREGMLNILQNRSLPIQVREGLILGMANDIQRRVKKDEIFDCYPVIEKYQGTKAAEYTQKVLQEDSEMRMPKDLFAKLYQLELLKKDWGLLLLESEKLLYQNGSEAYWNMKKEYQAWQQENTPDFEICLEQLLVYFVFTYFVGAVYDGNAYTKTRFCVSMVHLMEEIWMARWVKNEGQISMEEMEELLYRFSREVEHSDHNLKIAESIMGR